LILDCGVLLTHQHSATVFFPAFSLEANLENEDWTTICCFVFLQYRDVVSDLNEVAHHRPRSTLILGSQEENARIRELQQENIELQTSVAEYQSALELIMAKYREQVSSCKTIQHTSHSC